MPVRTKEGARKLFEGFMDAEAFIVDGKYVSFAQFNVDEFELVICEDANYMGDSVFNEESFENAFVSGPGMIHMEDSEGYEYDIVPLRKFDFTKNSELSI